MLAPPELKRLHPLGKSPMLEDDGVLYAETGAIFEHLLVTYDDGRLVPAEPEDTRRLTYWTHYAEGSAMPPLLLKLVFDVMPQRSPGLMRPLVRLAAGRASCTWTSGRASWPPPAGSPARSSRPPTP
jgi:glutathione S-transferase